MDIIKVSLDQFVTVLPLATRAPGTYTVRVDVNAPSVLSNVWFQAGPGASITANWYCVTTGAFPTERFDLTSHPALSGPPQKSQIIVTHAQGTVYLEVIVSGGSAQFGVMAKGAPDFPVMFSGDITALPYEGEPDTLSNAVSSTPGSPQTLISNMVDAGTRLDAFAAIVVCAFPSLYQVKVDGVLIGSGKTAPGKPESRFVWLPLQKVAAGATIDIEFLQSFGPTVDVEAYLQHTIVTI